ncbi:MAG: hypothetical protein DIU65_00980 [Proteobacteria bacterium]|nr:MAG: hypothetical protein DIU65_00980 [Pseudomonadota bacterium]
MADAYITLRRHWLRYARPDPERWAVRSAASRSVLQAHRYCPVIETLSKPKICGFSLATALKN